MEEKLGLMLQKRPKTVLFLSKTSWLVVPPRAALELCSLATERTQECFFKGATLPSDVFASLSQNLLKFAAKTGFC